MPYLVLDRSFVTKRSFNIILMKHNTDRFAHTYFDQAEAEFDHFAEANKRYSANKQLTE